ncbi:hypothetical protein N7G274_009151 [Stereocaulon virgatum]|uniref:Uncharacterized protein n=1 Tax=Stereocaulon virgatum TaxID=373712 RepID=A0ABR3ZXV1_9LECA
MQLTALLLAAAAAIASAQVVLNTTTGLVLCPAPGGNYCAGPSLESNIIIRCTGTSGQPGNCWDNLASVPPVGHKLGALCYQSTPTAGDAACSLDGIVYPDHGGAPFDIDDTESTEGTTTAPSTDPVTAEAARKRSLIGRVSTVIVYVTAGLSVPDTTPLLDVPASVSPITVSTRRTELVSTVVVYVTATSPTFPKSTILKELAATTMIAYPTATLNIASGGLVIVPSGSSEPRPTVFAGSAGALEAGAWVVRAGFVAAAAAAVLL